MARSQQAVDEAGRSRGLVMNRTPSEAVLMAYSEWLFYERRLLMAELYPGNPDAQRFVPCTRASNFHFPSEGEAAPPSSRALGVMAAAGVDLAVIEE